MASDATLGDICTAVAKRLDRFPSSILLQYRLDCDKAKDGCMSIQTLDELNMFKMRLRGLVVPQRLPNGKISTRAPKKVVVFFEDAATRTDVPSTDLSTGNGKKSVCFILPLTSSFQALYLLSRVQLRDKKWPRQSQLVALVTTYSEKVQVFTRI